MITPSASVFRLRTATRRCAASLNVSLGAIRSASMTVRLSQTPLIGVASAAAQLVKSMSLSDLFVKPNHQNTYRRGFCNTNRNFNTNSTSRERDPTHPSLFYHPVLSSSHSPVFALSFLDKPLNEGHPRSRIIIGWVTEGTGEDGIGSGFQENPPFRELLHESIACALAAPDLDPSIAAEAVQRGEGYLHINDHRNIPAMGRIGDPDDIIGSVMVQDGKILASTYQPMPSYRVCTVDGPTRLPSGLERKLQESLDQEWEKERR